MTSFYTLFIIHIIYVFNLLYHVLLLTTFSLLFHSYNSLLLSRIRISFLLQRKDSSIPPIRKNSFLTNSLQNILHYLTRYSIYFASCKVFTLRQSHPVSLSPSFPTEVVTKLLQLTHLFRVNQYYLLLDQ